ncbi:MAG: hypothetical protein ABIO72_00725 [Patescibacteria group bacterium]
MATRQTKKSAKQLAALDCTTASKTTTFTIVRKRGYVLLERDDTRQRAMLSRSSAALSRLPVTRRSLATGQVSESTFEAIFAGLARSPLH